MDSSRRRCFDCKHYIDAAVADTLAGGATVNKFDFYHRFVVAAAVGRRSIAHRNIDLIRDVDKSAHCVIDRSRFASSAEVVAAVAVAAFGFVIYLA